MNHPRTSTDKKWAGRPVKVIMTIAVITAAYLASRATSTSGTVATVDLVYGMNATAVEVAKETLPAGDQTRFTFSGIFSGTLAGGESTFVFVSPGTYFVTEAVPEGWLLNDIHCDDDDSAGVVETRTAVYIVSDGETVRCTFVNQLPANIIVEKVTVPGGSLQEFTFTTDYSQAFQLSHGQNQDSGSLLAGTYVVQESPQEGWVLDSATCDDGSNPAAIDLDGGETVTCTFVNRREYIMLLPIVFKRP